MTFVHAHFFVPPISLLTIEEEKYIDQEICNAKIYFLFHNFFFSIHSMNWTVTVTTMAVFIFTIITGCPGFIHFSQFHRRRRTSMLRHLILTTSEQMNFSRMKRRKKSLWPTERVGLIDSTDVMDCDVFVVAWHRATMVITKEDNFLYVECALVPWMHQQQLNNDQKDGKNRMLLSNAT